MVYAVRRAGNRWEFRESNNTPQGPRSVTLATFRTVTPDTLQLAQERSTHGITKEDLERAAERAGAPIATSEIDELTKKLIGALAKGRKPRPAYVRLLRAALDARSEPPNMAEWVDAPLEERGEALRDLLGLADTLPHVRRIKELRFPRIDSTAK